MTMKVLCKIEGGRRTRPIRQPVAFTISMAFDSANPYHFSNMLAQPVTENVYQNMAAWQGWSFILEHSGTFWNF